MARLFVAVRPPASLLSRVAELPRPAEPGVRWVPAEQWHVTLRFLGEADLDAVARALERATPRLRSWPPVEVSVGPRVSRLGRQVICLPVSGLEELAGLVAGATSDLGRPPDPRPFRGHVTLARLRHRGSCGLTGHPLSGRFTVSEVELVSSVLGHEGARHEVVRAYPLTR